MLKHLAQLGLYILIGCAVAALFWVPAVYARANPTFWFAFDVVFLVFLATVDSWLAARHYRARRITNLLLTVCMAVLDGAMVARSGQSSGLVRLYAFALIWPAFRRETQPVAMVALGLLGTLLALFACFAFGNDPGVEELYVWTLRLAGVFILPMPLYTSWLSRADQQLASPAQPTRY